MFVNRFYQIISKTVEKNSEELQKAAENNEKVEYSVDIFFLFSDAVADSAHRIGDTARKHPHKARLCHRRERRFRKCDNAPAHYNVAGH